MASLISRYCRCCSCSVMKTSALLVSAWRDSWLPAVLGLLSLASVAGSVRIIIIIIIIAFKALFEIFYNLLTAPLTVSNWQHIRSSGQGAIVCKSRSTHQALITCKCHVTCHLVRRDRSAIKFDRVEITFIWALFYWLNNYANEGGEETRVPIENPWQQASENATYYSPKIQAPSKTRIRAAALVAG